jgi:hypothetical protein
MHALVADWAPGNAMDSDPSVRDLGERHDVAVHDLDEIEDGIGGDWG